MVSCSSCDSCNYGWVSVTLVCVNNFCFRLGYIDNKCSVGKDGVLQGESRQTVFWDEIKFEPPPRPKRKVKKIF